VRARLSAMMKANEGVTAIEYGLIAALIAVVCIAVWSQLGTGLSATFSTVASSI
jgi:pilus assembly protein Flp/PilA